jgi:hypothetical protein
MYVCNIQFKIPSPPDKKTNPSLWPQALERPFEWHQRGEPFQLLLTTIISVAGQYAALGVITLTVYTSNTLFVKCDSRQQPIAVALACECTTLGYFSIASGCWYQYCS